MIFLRVSHRKDSRSKMLENKVASESRIKLKMFHHLKIPVFPVHFTILFDVYSQSSYVMSCSVLLWDVYLHPESCDISN